MMDRSALRAKGFGRHRFGSHDKNLVGDRGFTQPKDAEAIGGDWATWKLHQVANLPKVPVLLAPGLERRSCEAFARSTLHDTVGAEVTS